METFEKHILNTLNRKLHDDGIHGEFYFVKSYVKANFNLQKNFLVTLHFKSLKKNVEVYRIEKPLNIPVSDVQKGYETVFEQLLYALMFDGVSWNSISTRLQ